MQFINNQTNNRIPTKLEMLEIIKKRNRYTNDQEVSELNRLRAGQQGEDTVTDYLQEYGQPHWLAMKNVWLNYYGTIECDLILFTNSDWYLLEIKNYSGFYSYNQGISTLNSYEMSIDPIVQTRKAKRKVQDIANLNYSNIQVHGILIFAGIDNLLEIQPTPEDIQIIQRHELRHFIEQIVFQEKNSRIESSEINKLFQPFIVENPYPVTPLSPERLERLQKGIFCVNCANSNIKITKKCIHCPCGSSESREDAIVRTIQELETLKFSKPLTLNSALEFLNGQAGATYTRHILNTYFKIIKPGRNTQYQSRK